MLQFLSPVWLWAAAAVAVPIAIHLWNKKPPQTVPVGSIRWLQPSQSQRLSSLHLTQPWLLLLRCLLILLLALLLAGLHWKREVPVQPEKHAFLHPALFQPQYLSQIAATVDSMAVQGWRIHRLQPAFPELSLTPETSIRTFQVNSLFPDTTNAWAMARVLNRSLPSHATAQIFTTDLLRHHRGEHPLLRNGFSWIPVSVPRTQTWLQEAYYTSSGQLLLQFGRSEEQEITFTEHRVAKPISGQVISVPGFPSVRFTSHSEVDSLHLLGSARNTIPLRKEPLQVLVRYSQSRQADVRYLGAALQAALEYKGVAHTLTVSSDGQPLPTSAPDWVFWLSDESLTSFLARFPQKKLKTLQDAPASAKAQPVSSWLQIPRLSKTIPLHRRIPVTINLSVEVLWQDGFGQPMLTQQTQQNATQYHFYSRFHPDWNNLPDSGHFPELLLRLLFPEDSSWRTLYDTRSLPKAVERPRMISASFSENKPTTTEESIDLKPWLVALVVLLLALERWFASRSKTQQIG
ncbi:BatA domain-containing protein [Rufibacter psychrotolerans]|uniref:BatA domain-containing protein n=1 Tax=Rufibacter psychrotolerans TaxID=2812556 RepID=UPI00196728AB|nr:BatA domain-containing protein [Rufibacter sp. SYSU D00308]